MSTEVKNAVESALADCCQTFGSSSGSAAEAQASMKEAVENALKSADSFLEFQDNFAAALEAKLLLIPGFDPVEVLKIVEGIWDQYIEPFDFDFIPNPFEAFVKKLAKPSFLWIAQKVISKILGA